MDAIIGLKKYNTQLRELQLIHEQTFLESSETLEYQSLVIKELQRSLHSLLQTTDSYIKLVRIDNPIFCSS